MYHGILIIHKEKGFTSHDVVAKLRGICGQRKIGHTGTLDPEATGVLPVCLGSGTRLCDMLTDQDKEYVARLRLGVETDTQDTTGRILAEHPVEVSREEVCAGALSFVGEYLQVPPMYSALKVDGKKLYELARQGREVERQPRHVDILSINILEMNLPDVRFVVSCSKGTYIRTLCADIGDKLACGAAMAALKRTRVGSFKIEDAITLSKVQELAASGQCEDYVVAPDYIFMEYAGAVVKPEAENALANGNKLRLNQVEIKDNCYLKEGDLIRIYNGRKVFKAVYCFVKKENILKPYKMFL